MSTDMQSYSIENQSQAIALYAASRGLTIVRSYEDVGKSGLRLDGRHALKNLIDDVISGRADFQVILVYDVSRWGRFQDCDESAYYEFICKEAGVTVEYCAEQFTNDGSLTATVIKTMKRAMAGEYSRELSAKVFAGQSKIAAKGFHLGCAPYGLRRCLVGSDGNRKTELAVREWKSITTDRVILVPGPPEEVETVKSIFRMYVDGKMTLNEIARRLNADGKTTANRHPWLGESVRDLLANEKYIGHNVYNMTSRKLGGKWRQNPRSQWIRARDAFEPIVSRELFQRAQSILDDNSCYTANELLDSLTAIWCQKGTLSAKTVAASPLAPCGNAFRRCFGGLMYAYPLVGYTKPRVQNWVKSLNIRKAINNELIKNVQQRGGNALVQPKGFTFRINDELWVTTSIARLVTTKGRPRRWILGYKSRQRPDILVVARMAEDRESARDYFILPYFMINQRWLTFADGDVAYLKQFKSNSLLPLFELLAREPVQLLANVSERQLASGCSIAQTPNNDEIVPISSIEGPISSIIDKLRDILSDGEFINCMLVGGLRTMPRLLRIRNVALRQQGSHYLASVLEFAIVRAFVLRLVAAPRIAAELSRGWPEFTNEMKMVYLSVLSRGPFAR